MSLLSEAMLPIADIQTFIIHTRFSSADRRYLQDGHFLGGNDQNIKYSALFTNKMVTYITSIQTTFC